MSDVNAAMHRPADIEELCGLVRRTARLLPRGGGSKPGLSTASDVEVIDLRSISGIVDYQPAEFTLTARAGTPLREVVEALGAEGQYLPFDPPLVEAGATLGGTVAAGLSGPGRVRHGGVRDFLLAVRFVDGRGELRRGGAPVVKNAAGFDLPKLLVGSLGRLGILTELTLKVFPRPASYSTGRFEFPDFAAARRALVQLNTGPFDLDALELRPPTTVWVRLGGPEPSLPQRFRRLGEVVGKAAELLEDEVEVALWQGQGEFSWAPLGWALVKVPLTAGRIVAVDGLVSDLGAERCYSAGGAVAWVALPPSQLEALHGGLVELRLPGLVLRGEPPSRSPLLGSRTGTIFLERLRGVLDPEGRFPSFDAGASDATSPSPR